MEKLKGLLEELKVAQKRWCAEEVDDAEEMWIEYPDFINRAIPIIEEVIKGTV